MATLETAMTALAVEARSLDAIAESVRGDHPTRGVAIPLRGFIELCVAEARRQGTSS